MGVKKEVWCGCFSEKLKGTALVTLEKQEDKINSFETMSILLLQLNNGIKTGERTKRKLTGSITSPTIKCSYISLEIQTELAAGPDKSSITDWQHCYWCRLWPFLSGSLLVKNNHEHMSYRCPLVDPAAISHKEIPPASWTTKLRHMDTLMRLKLEVAFLI